MTADVIAAGAKQRQAIRSGPWHQGNPPYCRASSGPGIGRFSTDERGRARRRESETVRGLLMAQ
jgi:hypothetical protein